MRIFLITLFTLVALGVLIMMARIWGLGQTFPIYEHSFFNGSTPLIIVKIDTLEQAQEALALRPDSVFWLDVRFSKEKVPIISPQAPTPLKEFYSQLPQSRFVLNIVDNVADAHTALVEAIKDFKPKERTLIQSNALVLMTAIKGLKPEWVYGTSTPDLMRLLTFDTMLVLPSTQFQGDVFIAPFTIMKRPAFNDAIITEMRRRNKRIFLGPIETEAQYAEASRIKAEGYITSRLPELLRLLGQGPGQ